MISNFAFLDLDMPELLIILVIVLLLFGGKKLPELSKSIGQSMKELRKGFSEDVTSKPDSKNASKSSQDQSVKEQTDKSTEE